MTDVAVKNERRVEYIDIAKAIGIYLVILGHAVSSDTVVKNVVYSFHMPLFFILSGMVIRKKDDYRLKAWINIVKKKFFTLIIPYIVWGCIYSAFSFKNLFFIAYGTRETLIFADSLTSLWFLPTLFISGILAEFVISISRNTKWIPAIVAVGMFTVAVLLPDLGKFGYPWGVNIGVMATAFILFGYTVKDFISEVMCNKNLLKFATLVLCMAVFYIGVRYSNSEVGYVLMGNAVYGNPLVFALNALSGSLVVIILSTLVSALSFYKTPLLYAGKNTLGIFVVHKPIVEFIRYNIEGFGIEYNFVMAIAVSAITLVISCIVVKIISCFIPALLGKK